MMLTGVLLLMMVELFLFFFFLEEVVVEFSVVNFFNEWKTDLLVDS